MWHERESRGLEQGVLISDQRTRKEHRLTSQKLLTSATSIFGLNAVVGNEILGIEGVVSHMNLAELVASPLNKHILHSSRPPEFGHGKKKKQRNKMSM